MLGKNKLLNNKSFLVVRFMAVLITKNSKTNISLADDLNKKWHVRREAYINEKYGLIINEVFSTEQNSQFLSGAKI